jgi:hypothetical protein
MELKEQVTIAKDELAKAIIIALENKQYGTARKFFEAFNTIHDNYIPRTMNSTSFNISSSPDIISFGGSDSGICLG